VKTIKFIDLFCGLGGFHVAANQVADRQGIATKCVFSSDIDQDAQTIYEANFGIKPIGDITQVVESSIPNHDVLFARFPCQAFSIIGDKKGFEDTRGTLFFDVARILAEKKPSTFVLENVKGLRGHDGGRTLRTILKTLDGLGYWVDYRVLNALDFGLPQKRERILIVGFLNGHESNFEWPTRSYRPEKSLEEVLEPNSKVDKKYFASERIREARYASVASKDRPKSRTIWHQNKSGNISMLPYSCALRAGASYNYLLVDGVRRMTEREMFRLQGFPESYQLIGNYQSLRKQAGNSVPVAMIEAVVDAVFRALQHRPNRSVIKPSKVQPELFDI